jgi:hypothetical protein
MPAALIVVVLAAITLVLILLAVVVVGIRQEPRSAELSDVAPSPITGLVRRLTGLSVRRPTPNRDPRSRTRGRQSSQARAAAEGNNLTARREEVNNRCRHTPWSR